jgi:hypothetical protein
VHFIQKGGPGMKRSLLCIALVIWPLLSSPASASVPVETQGAERVDRLERELAELRAAIDELRQAGIDEQRLVEVERRLEILATEVENLKVGEAAVIATRADAVPGLGPAASKVYQKESGVSIGGYGEALFESFDSSKDDGSESGKVDQFDLLRAVLYFGYKFNDRFLFNSEIEFEHASTSKSGSASVEFAYVDYLYRPGFNARAGLVLIPMGFVNELHEPTVFLGAKRPETERRIIPTTWRENGIGAYGDFGGFSYRSYVVNGLDGSDFSASGLRDGRQKGSKAKADDFAWVGRLDWIGTPGLLLGGSVYTGDSGQGMSSANGGSLGVRTTIWEGHLDYRHRGIELRGLYARADLDEVAELNEALGLTGQASIGELLEGYYLQAGYDLFGGRRGRSLTPFVRWERLNTQAEVPDGYTANPATDQEIMTLGLAYQPIEQLIIKLDYQNVENKADTGVDQVNVGLGYIF